MKKYEWQSDWGHTTLTNIEDSNDVISNEEMNGLEVQYGGKKGKLHLGLTTSSHAGHGMGHISMPHYFIAFENCDLYRVGNGDEIILGWDNELDLG